MDELGGGEGVGDGVNVPNGVDFGGSVNVQGNATTYLCSVSNRSHLCKLLLMLCFYLERRRIFEEYACLLACSRSFKV